MIPYGHQEISEEDINAVIEVLRSDYLTQGTAVPKFEQAISSYTKSKWAVATNSGTSALHIAALALGLKEGDWLWTTPITFVASANCGRYCGATNFHESKVVFILCNMLICSKSEHQISSFTKRKVSMVRYLFAE